MDPKRITRLEPGILWGRVTPSWDNWTIGLLRCGTFPCCPPAQDPPRNAPDDDEPDAPHIVENP